eukprot:9479734-Pyramimonas_sp.AAC.3
MCPQITAAWVSGPSCHTHLGLLLTGGDVSPDPPPNGQQSYSTPASQAGLFTQDFTMVKSW